METPLDHIGADAPGVNDPSIVPIAPEDAGILARPSPRVSDGVVVVHGRYERITPTTYAPGPITATAYRCGAA